MTMVVGVDESEHSYYALQWTLRHFFAVPVPLFKLVVVTAKPTPSSVVGLAGPGISFISCLIGLLGIPFPFFFFFLFFFLSL